MLFSMVLFLLSWSWWVVIYYFILAVVAIGLVDGLDPEEEVTDVVCDEAELKDGE